MTQRNYVYRFLLLSAALLALMAAVNYIADPLWMFRGSEAIPVKQVDFNERQQKTNYLHFKAHDFDALVLGNSRSTYIDQNAFAFKDAKVFNYACNAMFQNEYDGFIEIFTKLTGNDPKYIIIGMDYIYGRPDDAYEKYREEVFAYYRKSMEPSYRAQSLLLLDTLIYSLQDLKKTWDVANGVYDRKQRFYDKKNVKGLPGANSVDYSALFANQVPVALEARDFKADRDYYAYLQSKYPEAEFVIFIPPVPNEILRAYHDNGMEEAFLLWVRDLTQSFGKVYNFMYPNPISADGRNFFDAAHFYPNVGAMIAGQISSEMGSRDDFGVLLTPENVDDFIREYQAAFQKGAAPVRIAKEAHAL